MQDPMLAGTDMPRDARLLLLGSCVAMLGVGENSTAVMAAMPAMSSDLGLSPAAVEWVINAYLLAAAAFIILGGQIADQFGAARSSAAGLALFALASLTISLSPNGLMVIAARALQGLGAAFAVSGTLVAVTEGATETERARAIGSWTGFLMLGFSIGPLVGGFLTHYGGWRSTFGFNVLIMFLAGLVLWLRSRPGSPSRNRLDWLGVGLLALFMPMLISALHALPTAGATPRGALVPIMLAAIFFAALLWVETRNPRPLLDFGLFFNHDFGLASLLAFLLMFDIMTLLLYYNLFAQAPDGLGMSAVAAGLSLVPLSVALFGFARMTPRLSATLGIGNTMVGGSLLLALGCAIAWVSLAGLGFTVLMLGLLLAGAGIALPYASIPRIGLAALPMAQAGKGSGVLNACSFLGGTVGVTCGGIVFNHSGFSAVLALLTIFALLGAGLSLRLRS